jgi:outer membrane murein-binding lipoprotein Lpp
VYYANAIDVSISSSTAQSAQLVASTQALVEKFEQLTHMRDQLKALAPPAPATGNSASQANTEANQKAASDLASKISEKELEVDRLSKAILPDAPGFTGSVKRVSNSGVTLTQIFPRPMAIGYRGLAYDTGDKLVCPKPKAAEL